MQRKRVLSYDPPNMGLRALIAFLILCTFSGIVGRPPLNTPAVAQPIMAREDTGFGFYQLAVPLERSSHYAVLDVDVSYVYKDGLPSTQYPDVRKIVAAVLEFLEKYPDKRAYYEVIARDLAYKLLAELPELSSTAVKLTIRPDTERSYTRIAVATVTRK